MYLLIVTFFPEGRDDGTFLSLLGFINKCQKYCDVGDKWHNVLSEFHSEAQMLLEKLMKETTVDRRVKTRAKETKEVKQETDTCDRISYQPKCGPHQQNYRFLMF